MPAKDHYHDIVKRALIKNGWAILDDQYFIGTETRQLWVDLHIEEKAGERRALVEVKSFLVGESAVENLANTRFMKPPLHLETCTCQFIWRFLFKPIAASLARI